MAADCDVLIVGLGPVGAALAALLGDLGVSVLVVEKDPEVYPLPRAAHFDHEIMRLFQQLGVTEAVSQHARPAPAYEFRAADGRVLMRMEGSAGGSPSGWRASYMFHQPGLEHALRAKVAADPKVETRIGVRFTGYIEDAEGVVATLEGPGGRQTVRARFLVGCDGGSSAVRAALGGGLFDYGFDEPWLVIDVRVNEGARVPDVNLQICDPARPTTCVLMGEGRHRWEFMLKPGETAEEVLDVAFIQTLLAPWKVDGAVTLERKAVYRFHALVADRWRIGRVLLAGDAAHQMPPFAGQGLCSGVRDAANLAWKLAAILRGEAGETLLDAYQPEREPNVRAIIDMALLMGRTVCITDPAAAAERDRAMLAQRAAGQGPGGAVGYPPISAGAILAGSPAAGELFPQPWSAASPPARLDDILGPGPWLISRSSADPVDPALRQASLTDPDMAPYAADLGGWLDRRGVADAVLIRPDRYVFGSGAPADLVRAWTEALGA